MTEEVYILRINEAAITIFDAMVKAKGSDVIDAFGIDVAGDGTKVMVAMQVNGVEVPVAETLSHFWERANSALGKRALELASEMVGAMALDAVQDKLAAFRESLEMAEIEIKNEMRDWLKERGHPCRYDDN